MNHFQITFSPISKEISDILIALLSEQNFDGFTEEENTLHAFIPESDWIEKELQDIIAPFSISYTKELVQQRNWNADWESSYDPIIVNEQVAIRATFHEPISTVAHNIIIIPKMSFGTGHHATTRMMMEYISEQNFAGKSILDYGCGTGVLAIYALHQGAKFADAIDIDEWCVENTLENIALNNATNIEVAQGDLDLVLHKKYDVILANINLYILIKQMKNFYEILNSNGQLYMSGILDTDVPNLQKCAEEAGFISTFQKQSLNWCALHMTKK
jgi:ribosomal protein L11 methyltransferase